jgi:hypothetical protein
MLDDPNKVIALASLVVACVAILFAYSQVTLTRKHNRLSVRPQLALEPYGTTDREKDGDITVIIKLENNGLGPAFVEGWKLYFDSDVIGTNKDVWAYRNEVITRVCEFEPTASRYCIIYVDGYAIPPSNSADLIKIVVPRLAGKSFDCCWRFMDRFGFLIRYSSIYGEHFQVTYNAHKLD